MLVRNIQKEYLSNDKGQYSCQYYVVFCTKFNRRIFVNDYAEYIKCLLNKVAEENEVIISDVRVEGDAIHLILNCSPHISVQKNINQMKIMVAKELHQKYPELKTRMPQIWTKKNFISSMGDVSYTSISEYIENQRNENKKTK